MQVGDEVKSRGRGTSRDRAQTATTRNNANNQQISDSSNNSNDKASATATKTHWGNYNNMTQACAVRLVLSSFFFIVFVNFSSFFFCGNQMPFYCLSVFCALY